MPVRLQMASLHSRIEVNCENQWPSASGAEAPAPNEQAHMRTTYGKPRDIGLPPCMNARTQPTHRDCHHRNRCGPLPEGLLATFQSNPGIASKNSPQRKEYVLGGIRAQRGIFRYGCTSQYSNPIRNKVGLGYNSRSSKDNCQKIL